MKKRQELLQRIAKAMLKNYDECLYELEEPYVSLLIDSDKVAEIPLPKGFEPIEDEILDELWGTLSDIRVGTGITLCTAVPDGYGGFERNEEFELDELDSECLEAICKYVEEHEGSHIGVI